MSCFNNLANIYNNKIIKPHFLKTQPKSKIIEYLTELEQLKLIFGNVRNGDKLLTLTDMKLILLSCHSINHVKI